MTDLVELARFVNRNLDLSPQRLLALIRKTFPEATPVEIEAAVRVLDDPDFNRRRSR
jgi:hypothetical protein